MCLCLGIDPVEEQQTTASDGSDQANDDLPVNNALGRTIGDFLNGKKTGAGLLGILVALMVPLFEPHAANISSASFGVSWEEPALSASGIALPIFLVLFLWGVLGKAEKWVKGLVRN